MLQLIRDRAQGIVIWTIVVLLVVGLTFSILASYVIGSGADIVADVNGTEISKRQYDQAYHNYQSYLQRLYGENFRPELFGEALMRKNVLDQLINNEVQQQFILEAGFRTSANQVRDYISRIPAFQGEDGRFSEQRYKQVLRQIGQSPQEFAEEQVVNIASQQIHQSLSQSVFLPADYVQQFEQLSQQQRDIAYTIIPKANALKEVAVTEDEIKTYYAANKIEYMTQPQVKVRYAELELSKLAAKLEVSVEDAKSYYNENKQNYKRDDFQAAQKEIQAIAKQLKQGKDFAELAKEKSQDSSAKDGGDLGFFGRGAMVPAFETAVFALKKGEVSKPVKTEYGYHLIKLEEIKKDKTEQRRARHILIKPGKVEQSFDEVKEQIIKQLQTQRAETRYYEDETAMERLAYDTPDSLESVKEELGLEIKTTDMFSRASAPGILRNPKVLAAIFSDEVLKEGANSEVIKLSNTHSIVVRVQEYQPAKQRSLEDVSELIKSRLSEDKARELVLEHAQQYLAELKQGKDAQTMLKEKGLDWTRVGFIGRNNQNDAKKLDKPLPAAIRSETFRMARPEQDKLSYAMLPLNNGDAAVIGLYAVQSKADDAQTPDKARQEANQRQLQQAIAQEQSQALLDFLRENSDITITPPKEEEL